MLHLSLRCAVGQFRTFITACSKNLINTMLSLDSPIIPGIVLFVGLCNACFQAWCIYFACKLVWRVWRTIRFIFSGLRSMNFAKVFRFFKMEWYLVPKLIAVISFIARWFTDMPCGALLCRATSEVPSHVYVVIICLLLIVVITKAKQIKETMKHLQIAEAESDDDEFSTGGMSESLPTAETEMQIPESVASFTEWMDSVDNDLWPQGPTQASHFKLLDRNSLVKHQVTQRKLAAKKKKRAQEAAEEHAE